LRCRLLNNCNIELFVLASLRSLRPNSDSETFLFCELCALCGQISYSVLSIFSATPK
jgi:hypothetical protein